MSRALYGGQALIEGLMIRGPERTAIAVRSPGREIVLKCTPNAAKSVWRRLPLLRGAAEFFAMNVQGVRALLYSAQVSEEGAESEPPAQASMVLAAALAVAFSVGLFILLPGFVSGLLPIGSAWGHAVLEGVLRLGIFAAYLGLTSRLKEMQRVWMYHGAEHKTIHCHESGAPLTVANVQRCSTRHVRCGTSFLFLVMCISIVLYSLVGWRQPLVNAALRLALLPLVAGVSYELFRVLGRRDNALVRLLVRPGLAFQRLTTREPDDEMVEVAIAAFAACRTEAAG